jgi:hypothetical protein
LKVLFGARFSRISVAFVRSSVIVGFGIVRGFLFAVSEPRRMPELARAVRRRLRGKRALRI